MRGAPLVRNAWPKLSAWGACLVHRGIGACIKVIAHLG
jgi:hypothetical protein